MTSVKWLAAVLGAAFLLAGCSLGKGSSDKMVRTGAVPTRTTANKRLLTEPSPLSLADVARYPAGSPERAVTQLLFWAQWGNLPAVVGGYDPVVVSRLGVSRITASYAWLFPTLASARPRLVEHRRVGRNSFVSVELLTRRYAPERDSFLLRPEAAGRWRVVWDTLLARSLSGWTVDRLTPDPNKPSFRVRRAAEAAAQAYRNIYASLAARATIRARRP
jgi:hypothetical protein